MRPSTSPAEINHYFEYENQGIQVDQDGLSRVAFGEFLVERLAITRQDLFVALQLQDQSPGVRLGECLAKMGKISSEGVALLLEEWNGIVVVEAGLSDESAVGDKSVDASDLIVEEEVPMNNDRDASDEVSSAPQVLQAELVTEPVSILELLQAH